MLRFDLLPLVTADRQLGDRVKRKRGCLAAKLGQQAVHLLVVSRNHANGTKAEGMNRMYWLPCPFLSLPPSLLSGDPIMETCLQGPCPPGSHPLACCPFAHPPSIRLLPFRLRAGLCSCTAQTDQPLLPRQQWGGRKPSGEMHKVSGHQNMSAGVPTRMGTKRGPEPNSTRKGFIVCLLAFIFFQFSILECFEAGELNSSLHFTRRLLVSSTAFLEGH